jgi:hypothetical protein
MTDVSSWQAHCRALENFFQNPTEAALDQAINCFRQWYEDFVGEAPASKILDRLDKNLSKTLVPTDLFGKAHAKIAGPDLDAEFEEEFWPKYPKAGRAAKQMAKKAWQRARKKASKETILAGLDRYAKMAAADPARPVKYAQGWLTAERWTDGVEVTSPVAPPMPPTSAPASSKNPRVGTPEYEEYMHQMGVV